jgi:hypothetical protein
VNEWHEDGDVGLGELLLPDKAPEDTAPATEPEVVALDKEATKPGILEVNPEDPRFQSD